MERKNPETSHEAYRSLRSEEIREIYQKIIEALKIIRCGTYEDISRYLKMEPSKIWKRLSEMERLELVYRPGDKKKLSSGRNGLVWYLTGDAFPKSAPVEKAMKGKSVSEFSKRINTIRQASLF